MKEIVVDVAGIAWLFYIATAVAYVCGVDLRYRRLRDHFWTLRHKGDPITVAVADGLHTVLIERRTGDSIDGVCTSCLLPPRGCVVDISQEGTIWCWGHEGEAVEALAVAMALL